MCCPTCTGPADITNGSSVSRYYAGPADAQLITGRPYAELVAKAAEAHGVPQALLHALIKAESGYNPKARSPRGSRTDATDA